MEPRAILISPDQAGQARRISAFYQFGMPGMTLLAGGVAAAPPKPEAPHAFGTCQCGKRISRNKTRCGACYLVALKQIAETIDRPQLEEFLKDMDGLDRLEVLGTIRPFLKFELPPGGGTTS
jgi:hypothetical protein